MICYSLFCIILSILSMFSVYYGSALDVEDIIGGYNAFQLDFKYHVGLIGKYNYTNVPYLLGSAGILSSSLLLSSARCFMLTNYELKKLMFFATVGMSELKSKHLPLYEIEEIYTYNYRSYQNKNNIAVSKLKDILDLVNSPNLAPLEIPDIEETFYGDTALVSGYGINSLNNLAKQNNREQVRITTKNSLQLKYAKVLIVNEQMLVDKSLICNQIASLFTELCGMIFSDDQYNYRGVCWGDNGGPLVIGNKIVGVVNTHTRECDDISIGTIYTKVSKYNDFLRGLLRGSPLSGTTVYKKSANIFQYAYTWGTL